MRWQGHWSSFPNLAPGQPQLRHANFHPLFFSPAHILFSLLHYTPHPFTLSFVRLHLKLSLLIRSPTCHSLHTHPILLHQLVEYIDSFGILCNNPNYNPVSFPIISCAYLSMSRPDTLDYCISVAVPGSAWAKNM